MTDKALSLETNRYLDAKFSDDATNSEDDFIEAHIRTQFESAENLAAAVKLGQEECAFDEIIAEIAYYSMAGRIYSLEQAGKRLMFAVSDQARYLAQQEWEKK